MKKPLLLLVFGTISFLGIAQNKMLTLEDALVNNRTSLAPENLQQLQFIYGTDDYVYLKRTNNKPVWVRGSFRNNDSPFLTLDQLNKKLKVAGMDTVAEMPAITFNQSAEWIMTVHNNKIAFDPVTGKMRVIINRFAAGECVRKQCGVCGLC